MATNDLSERDEGKPVVNEAGDKIGMISEVRGGTAHVDPDPGMMDKVQSKLGWGDSDEETYELPASEIAEVTDDEVRLGF